MYGILASINHMALCPLSILKPRSNFALPMITKLNSLLANEKFEVEFGLNCKEQ